MKTITKNLICGAFMVACLSTASAVNLIVNGDFQSGFIAPSTTDYDGTTGIGVAEGTYNIINNPIGPAPDRNPYADALPYYDHTFGTAAGLMMAVNGTDSGALVWGQTVTGLTVDQTYLFSMWVSTWDSLSPALLDVQINGVSQAIFSAPTTAAGTTPIWVNHSFLWTATSTSVGFTAIYDAIGILNGNDFALDDISLTAVPDGGSAVALLGIALTGIEVLRRKLRRA